MSQRNQLHLNMAALLHIANMVFQRMKLIKDLLSPLQETRPTWISSYGQVFKKHRVRVHGHLPWKQACAVLVNELTFHGLTLMEIIFI